MVTAALKLSYMTRESLSSLVIPRVGEKKVGQDIRVLDGVTPDNLDKSLRQSFDQGSRYVLLGIPEDAGPLANLGKGGSDKAWDVFLRCFLNTQSNRFLDPSKVLLLGKVDVSDLVTQAAVLQRHSAIDLKKIRELCAEVDERVAPVVSKILAAGLKPIIIGGGHNNAYPIIKAVAEASKEEDKSGQITCINCDPHADFRSVEDGRHSGNPFSFAHRDNLLAAYFVLGLHEGYNSEELLERLEQAGFRYRTYEDIKIKSEISFDDAVKEGIAYIKTHPKLAVGIELDLDSIAHMPVSALTPVGFSLEEVARYIHMTTTALNPAYLHIAEGAPGIMPQGDLLVGKGISKIVRTFISANEERKSST